jgi:hypothetical protein
MVGCEALSAGVVVRVVNRAIGLLRNGSHQCFLIGITDAVARRVPSAVAAAQGRQQPDPSTSRSNLPVPSHRRTTSTLRCEPSDEVMPQDRTRAACDRPRGGAWFACVLSRTVAFIGAGRGGYGDRELEK